LVIPVIPPKNTGSIAVRPSGTANVILTIKAKFFLHKCNDSLNQRKKWQKDLKSGVKNGKIENRNHI